MDKILAKLFDELDGRKWRRCTMRTPASESCVMCLKRQYFYGNVVSYDCIEKRKLYVLRYLPVHSAENRKGLGRVTAEVVENILKYAPIRVLSIGGGPGSDIHAVLQFLKREIDDVSMHKVFVTRVDIEPLWDEIAADVIKNGSSDLSIRLDTLHADAMSGLDILKDEDEEFDIVLCSYLISELDEATLQILGVKLRRVMWNGGVLMINDRPEEDVRKKIRMVFEAAEIDYSEMNNYGWAGFSYDDEVAQVVEPKFNMNSTVFWGVKSDN